MEPAKAFVEAAGEALVEIAPSIRAEPKINASIFRINRDIRFSKDKRPYKDHLDFWFWEGERKTAVSGFYLRITPTAIGIGAGAHGFDKDRLAAFRASVVDEQAGKRLADTVAAVEEAGWEVRGDHYKQLPRGFEASSDIEERLLRYASLWTGEDEPHPKVLSSKRFVSYCARRWAHSEPLHRWLVETLQ